MILDLHTVCATCTYVAAMWKMDVPHTPSADFVRLYIVWTPAT